MTNDTWNEDWLRTRTWDMYNGSVLVTTVPALLFALGLSAQPVSAQKSALEHFTTLPAWTAAPAGLKSDVATFLDPKTKLLSKFLATLSNPDQTGSATPSP